MLKIMLGNLNYALGGNVKFNRFKLLIITYVHYIIMAPILWNSSLLLLHSS